LDGEHFATLWEEMVHEDIEIVELLLDVLYWDRSKRAGGRLFVVGKYGALIPW
jgi:hypothetical protein